LYCLFVHEILLSPDQVESLGYRNTPRGNKLPEQDHFFG
jgi:hypothetical protein